MRVAVEMTSVWHTHTVLLDVYLLLTNCSQSPVPKAILLSALFKQDRGTRDGSFESHRPAPGSSPSRTCARRILPSSVTFFFSVRQAVVLRLPVVLRRDSEKLECATRSCAPPVRQDFEGESGGDLWGGLMSEPGLSLGITSARALSYSITHPFALFTL